MILNGSKEETVESKVSPPCREEDQEVCYDMLCIGKCLKV